VQQSQANASGLPVHTMKTTEAAACLGAAILAGVGAGIWRSVEETATRLAEYDLEYSPDTSHRALYERMLSDYKLLMTEASPLFRKLAAA